MILRVKDFSVEVTANVVEIVRETELEAEPEYVAELVLSQEKTLMDTSSC